MTAASYNRHWADGVLEDLVYFQRGFDITVAQQQPGPYPVISSSGTTSYHNQFMVNGPGIVIGRKGTLGSIHYTNDDYWPHDTTLWSKDLKGNNPRFVYYFLHTIDFKRFDVGNSNPTLNRNHIHGLAVRIPPPKTQQRIADILSGYDDLIANNRRRMALLEESARQLYREWFVRLRFPGREHTRITDGVPEGWERKPLVGACLSLDDGDWIESKDQGGEDYRLLQISNVGMNEFVETGNYRFISADTYRRLNCREVKPGDILISRMPTPIGRAWLVQAMPWKMVTAVDAAILTTDQTTPDRYFFTYHLNSSGHLELCEKRAGGATRPRISRRDLASLPVLLPSITLRKQFGEFVEPIINQRTSLDLQNQKLRSARDLLLPRLMSGEVAV